MVTLNFVTMSFSFFLAMTVSQILLIFGDLAVLRITSQVFCGMLLSSDLCDHLFMVTLGPWVLVRRAQRRSASHHIISGVYTLLR